MMVRSGMVTHLYQIALSMVGDLFLPTKTPPVDFAAKQAMHDNHRLLNILVDEQM